MTHKAENTDIWSFTEGFANSCPKSRPIYVTLGILVGLSRSQLSYLKNGVMIGSYLIGFLFGTSEIISINLHIIVSIY